MSPCAYASFRGSGQRQIEAEGKRRPSRHGDALAAQLRPLRIEALSYAATATVCQVTCHGLMVAASAMQIPGVDAACYQPGCAAKALDKRLST